MIASCNLDDTNWRSTVKVSLHFPASVATRLTAYKSKKGSCLMPMPVHTPSLSLADSLINHCKTVLKLDFLEDREILRLVWLRTLYSHCSPAMTSSRISDLLSASCTAAALRSFGTPHDDDPPCFYVSDLMVHRQWVLSLPLPSPEFLCTFMWLIWDFHLGRGRGGLWEFQFSDC